MLGIKFQFKSKQISFHIFSCSNNFSRLFNKGKYIKYSFLSKSWQNLCKVYE